MFSRNNSTSIVYNSSRNIGFHPSPFHTSSWISNFYQLEL